MDYNSSYSSKHWMDFDHNFSHRSIRWILTTTFHAEASDGFGLHVFAQKHYMIWTTTFHTEASDGFGPQLFTRSIGWIWTTHFHTEALDGFGPQLFTQKHWILTLFMLVGALILHSESFVMLEPYTSYLKHLGFLIRQLNSLISY